MKNHFKLQKKINKNIFFMKKNIFHNNIYFQTKKKSLKKYFLHKQFKKKIFTKKSEQKNTKKCSKILFGIKNCSYKKKIL